MTEKSDESDVPRQVVSALQCRVDSLERRVGAVQDLVNRLISIEEDSRSFYADRDRENLVFVCDSVLRSLREVKTYVDLVLS